MTLQDKFDEIINCIELFIVDGEENIPEAVAMETGFNQRLLGDSFMFITGISLVKYIRQRRLVRALAKRIENNLSVEDVVADALFSDAAAFTKACKSEFDLPPGKITADVLAQHPPLHFARVISSCNVAQMEDDTLTIHDNTTNSVTAEQFAEIKEVLEISAVYGFNDNETELVYRLSKEYNIPIAEAADLCEEMRIEDIYDIYPSEMQEALLEIKAHGFMHLHELPEFFWDVYLSEENSKHGWHVPYVCEIAHTLKEYGMCAVDLEDIVLNADTFDVDIIEAIENFKEHENSWDDMAFNIMTKDIPLDDTDGFGYRSVWENDEEDPNQYDNDVPDKDF